MNDTPDQVIDLFNEALKLAPVERAGHLDRVCGTDGELRQRVEGLLRAYERAGDFPGNPVSIQHAGAPPQSPAGAGPGDRVGQYKLLQQIGEGGCGLVFMAKQEEPIRRRVALKPVKPGMDTKSVIARFEAERQALLANEPISARPPSRLYKFKKLVLRHKLPFLGIGVIALCLVASLAAVSAAAEAMRHSLIDRARRKQTQRHGGGLERIGQDQRHPWS